jgi:predicted small lipoprotein YifL
MRFPPRSPVLALAALLALVALAAGCGHKGPLFLRDSPPPGVKPPKPKPYEPVPYPRSRDEEEK